MPRVLLTGGSGFIAAHVLDTLLERGHSVVTTVRSHEKAETIAKAHPNVGRDKLDFAIVEDIAQPDAFEKAVLSDPPFEIVIHTASPFHFNITDTKKDLLDPAIIGTTGILKAIKKSAPTIERVVITSSFAAILNPKGQPEGYSYSEEDWNPITEEEALQNPSNGYRASKTFAEKAAWEFVEKEKPNFTVATCNPPLVFGPPRYLNSLSALNTSNQRIRDIMTGASKDKLPPSSISFWVDVRDIALAHVLAAEKPEAAGKRFFVLAGYFSNKQIVDIVREHFPELRKNLPEGDAAKEGDFPEGGPEKVMRFDNGRVREVLGVKFRSFEECIVDTVKSLQAVE